MISGGRFPSHSADPAWPPPEPLLAKRSVACLTRSARPNRRHGSCGVRQHEAQYAASAHLTADLSPQTSHPPTHSALPHRVWCSGDFVKKRLCRVLHAFIMSLCASEATFSKCGFARAWGLARKRHLSLSSRNPSAHISTSLHSTLIVEPDL